MRKEKPVTEDGYSRWITPKMERYRLGCCDCGLVNDMDFIAIRITERHPDGSFDFEELDRDEYRIAMRARRNNRSTAQIRRHEKKVTHPSDDPSQP